MLDSTTEAGASPDVDPCVAEDAGFAERKVLSLRTGLAVWRRRLPPPVAAWLDRLSPRRLPRGRGTVAVGEVAALIEGFCRDATTPGGPARDAFVADVAGAARAFARVAELRAVRVRLEVITTDACRRYHRDCVRLRLLATYRGPGTLWVPRAFGAAALALQQGYRGPVRQLTRDDVAIYKGSHWPGEGGLVHRSPPLHGTRAIRLLLAVDAPFEACAS